VGSLKIASAHTAAKPVRALTAIRVTVEDTGDHGFSLIEARPSA
jgi:hypothetical protein